MPTGKTLADTHLNMIKVFIVQWNITMQESLFFNCKTWVEMFHVYFLVWGIFLADVIPLVQ